VRHAATRALFTMGEKAIPTYIKLLEHKELLIRVNALKTLVAFGPKAKDALPTIEKMLTDENDQVRSVAVVFLRRVERDRQKLVPIYLELLKKKKSRQLAIRALSELAPDETVVPALVGVLKDKNIENRRLAAASLGAMGAKAREAVPALIAMLQEEEAPDQAEKLPPLEMFPGQRGMGMESAARALGEIGPDAAAAVPALLQALKSNATRSAAARSLGKIGPAAKSAVPALIELLSQNNDSQGYVVEGIGGIGPDAVAAVPALIQLLQNNSPAVRMSAAKALGRIGPAAKSAVEGLNKLLGDKVDYVRKEASIALDKILAEPGQSQQKSP
jgi:HEAT repeat protein